jgi:hypothetical protein
MNATRLWTLGAVVAVVAILGGAFGLGVQPHLAAAAEADRSAASATTQNSATELEIARLTKVAAKQPALEATDRALRIKVPDVLRMNSLSRMLRNTAALDGVEVEAFTPGNPTAYAPVSSDGSTTTSSAPASSSSSTPAPTASATPAAVPADPKSPWFGTTDPAITVTNFTVIPLTVTVTGPQRGVLAFASDAQEMERLFAVSTVSTVVDDSGLTTGVISGYVYTLDK